MKRTADLPTQLGVRFLRVLGAGLETTTTSR